MEFEMMMESGNITSTKYVIYAMAINELIDRSIGAVKGMIGMCLIELTSSSPSMRMHVVLMILVNKSLTIESYIE